MLWIYLFQGNITLRFGWLLVSSLYKEINYSTVPREGFDSSVIMPFSWCAVQVE